MNWIFNSGVRFLVVLIGMTIVCTVVWEFIADKLYDCTDDGGPDYLCPGNWVHGHIAVVRQIVHHRSMSEPDTIKAGWSVAGLWCLWFLFVAVSLFVSIWLARIRWFSRQQTE